MEPTLTLYSGNQARFIEQEELQEKYDRGELTFLGEQRIDGKSYCIYGTTTLPTQYHYYPVMQTHSGV